MIGTLLVAVPLAVLLGIGGYLLGVRRGRDRERVLVGTLGERAEEIRLARNEIKRLGLLDGLTEIANQHHFQEFLEREWRRSLRELTPISLLMIDIDHFKAYNTKLGHAAGDLCLTRVALALRSLVGRPGDLAARYGGEEFVVVLARTDIEGASVMADKIRSIIEALELPHPDSPVGPHVTVSLGVAAMVPSRETTWQEIELVAAAERAVLEAKRLGRNRLFRSEVLLT